MEDLQAFAEGLRGLKEKAGGQSLRSLAGAIHYSRTTLSDAFSGKAVPSLAVTLAIVRACGGDLLDWERRWRALRRSPPAAGSNPAIAVPWPPEEIVDDAEPEAAGCAREAVTAIGAKVALDGRRVIIGLVEVRHNRSAGAAWARFEGYASLDNLVRREESAEIMLMVDRGSDGRRIDYREEYAFDYHWTNILLVDGSAVRAYVEIYFGDRLVASGETAQIVLP
ncbi:helix-turn-helix domain-containing protein [Hamadaea tsunoensis]|uniref:helix-turn-helix domain-containing protein n=1 Tax=Hamadaea tsunoensis TaxID=53368 RepID=UPI0004122E0E|nr:helix-turn-helix transcriptional regulator [Hamadaea tsunoensis]